MFFIKKMSLQTDELRMNKLAKNGRRITTNV